ncbi:MAG: hypothetical protein H6704_24525 [Myxococcales bacterium]|nr:hypothetical protein [Myxococcales bacterium]
MHLSRADQGDGHPGDSLAGGGALTALLLALVALWGAPPAAGDRLAVLEITDAAALGDAAASVLTDAVRGAAAGLPPGIVIISRENLLALLPPGTDPTACLGDCEVETGRRLGARYVVAGRVATLGESLVLTLTLHATADGALLRSEQAEAATPSALADAARAAAARLLGGLRAGATAPDATDAAMLAILARPPAEQVGAFADLGDARAADDPAGADRAYRAAARALEGLNARTRLQDAVRGAAAPGPLRAGRAGPRRAAGDAPGQRRGPRGGGDAPGRGARPLRGDAIARRQGVVGGRAVPDGRPGARPRRRAGPPGAARGRAGGSTGHRGPHRRPARRGRAAPASDAALRPPRRCRLPLDAPRRGPAGADRGPLSRPPRVTDNPADPQSIQCFHCFHRLSRCRTRR